MIFDSFIFALDLESIRSFSFFLKNNTIILFLNFYNNNLKINIPATVAVENDLSF